MKYFIQTPKGGIKAFNNKERLFDELNKYTKNVVVNNIYVKEFVELIKKRKYECVHMNDLIKYQSYLGCEFISKEKYYYLKSIGE